MAERERNPRLEQMLESGLSADFRSEYLALQHAAEKGDRKLFLSFVSNLSAHDDRSSRGRLPTYDERFHDDPNILAATDREAQQRLGDIVQRMNVLLAQPAFTDLQEFAGLCQEADDLILGSRALPKAA